MLIFATSFVRRICYFLAEVREVAHVDLLLFIGLQFPLFWPKVEVFLFDQGFVKIYHNVLLAVVVVIQVEMGIVVDFIIPFEIRPSYVLNDHLNFSPAILLIISMNVSEIPHEFPKNGVLIFRFVE